MKRASAKCLIEPTWSNPLAYVRSRESNAATMEDGDDEDDEDDEDDDDDDDDDDNGDIVSLAAALDSVSASAHTARKKAT
jgi:hypothetical protein